LLPYGVRRLLAFVSRAPQERIARLKARMGWELIPWYTITDDFDVDLGVDEWHGTNAFIRDDEEIYRTYFVSGRGDEAMGGTWSYLDITALGRQEEWEDSPEGYPQTPPYKWWRLHDDYGSEARAWEKRSDAALALSAKQAGGASGGRAMIAYLGGLPVEESLLPFVSGAGAGILLARAWVLSFRGRPLLL
jgi:Bacterial protein of unknown function (DUF899)